MSLYTCTVMSSDLEDMIYLQVSVYIFIEYLVVGPSHVVYCELLCFVKVCGCDVCVGKVFSMW